MFISDFIDPALRGHGDWRPHPDRPAVVGIDIGSRTGKAVLLSGDQLYVAQVATGVSMQETAEELLEELLADSGLDRDRIGYAVGTGYGRISLALEGIPQRILSEITCHALGARSLHARTRTIVDIGGQDAKVIRVDPDTGKVAAFIMNDKCAAGTGRFLEKVAELLELTIDDLGPVSLEAGKELTISSQCVVFAESEVISLKARGETRADIAAGIHQAAASRVVTLLKRLTVEPDLLFTGGVSNNSGMRRALEQLVGHPTVRTRLDLIYAGALGAAVHARRFQAEQVFAAEAPDTGSALDLGRLEARLEARRTRLIAKADGRPVVGYLCNYTPLEIFGAAGIHHQRLFKAGSPDEVAAGEIITKSVFCDLTKSCLGAFSTRDPLARALDHVYTFYSCDSMKTIADALNQFYVPTDIYNVPRLKDREASRRFFEGELRCFLADVEKLAGHAVAPAAIATQIRRYNRVRNLLRRISALRKQEAPPLTGAEYLDLARAFWLLPAEELEPLYQDLLATLQARPSQGVPGVRLLMAGGVVADGDRRILELLEQDTGARVVVEDHCSGLSAFLSDVSEQGDPCVALAHGYLDRAPCARMVPLEERVETAVRLAREYRVDAVVFTYLKFCPCYGLTKNVFFRRFQEEGLPVLELPTDYSQSDLGQLKTRIDAFLEVLVERTAPRSVR